MKRRGFLSALLGAAAFDPERLLWVPGKKLISIPPPPKFEFFIYSMQTGRLLKPPPGMLVTKGRITA